MQRGATFVGVLVCIGATCATGVAADSTAVAQQASQWGFKELIPLAALIGTLLTAAVHWVRWIHERSKASRRAGKMAHALALAEFISSQSAFKAATADVHLSALAVSKAQAELADLLSDLTAPPKPISRLRKVLLLYVPRGWTGWVAHFLFYSGSAYILLLVWLLAFDDTFGMDGAAGIFGLLGLTAIVVAFQRWAALEYRLRQQSVLSPKRLIGSLRWYPANSRLGLLAQLMLFLGLTRTIGMFIPVSGVDFTTAVPVWEQVFDVVVRSLCLPVAYFWCETEASMTDGALPRPTIRRYWELLLRARAVEKLVAIGALTLVTGWFAILLFDFRLVSKAAALPDLNGYGTIGLAPVLGSFTAVLLVDGLMLWLAVSRGLWVILQEDGLSTNEIAEIPDSKVPNG